MASTNENLTRIAADHWQAHNLQGLDWGDWPPPAAPAPERVLAVVRDSRVLARCGIWWRDVPLLDGEQSGLIGQYAAQTGQAGGDLLRLAMAELADKGVRKVLGPMDGSTWHNHRWVTWSRGDAPFPMEPQQPERWVADWQAAGFAPFAGYHSSIASLDNINEPELHKNIDRLANQGIALRPIDHTRFAEELAAIHTLSLKSFQNNLFYQPISRDAFTAMYLPLQGRYDASASVLAEDRSGLVGFLFAYPAPPATEGEVPRLVIKTLAVAPDLRRVGLGKLLVERAYWAAKRTGYGQVIHALMQDDNVSAKLRADPAQIFRRYTLFVCQLESGR